MSILKYFKPTSESHKIPDARRPLYPTPVDEDCFIVEANRAVDEHLHGRPSSSSAAAATSSSSQKPGNDKPGCKRRNNYQKWNPETKIKIARYAQQHGDVAAQKHFLEKDNIKVAIRTLGTWKKRFIEEVKRGNEPTEVPTKERGRPTKVGEALTAEIKKFIKDSSDSGSVINRSIVRAGALGIIKKRNRGILKMYGGTVDITLDNAKYWMKQICFVKRKGTRTARKRPENFEVVRDRFHEIIKNTVREHNIPSCMVVNFDQTGIKIVPTSEWTMAERGSKQVDIVGLDDKRMITGVLAASLSGVLLPPQLIYAGLTPRCHPQITFPADWDITHSKNHWSNTATMLTYVDNVLVPYFDAMRGELGVPPEQHGLVIMDIFAAHRTDELLDYLASKNLSVAFVPAHCTPDLQPLDVSINNEFKAAVRSQFTTWYSDCVVAHMEEHPNQRIDVDLKISTLKPIHGNWVISAFDEIKDRRDIIMRGFVDSGIKAAVEAGQAN